MYIFFLYSEKKKIGSDGLLVKRVYYIGLSDIEVFRLRLVLQVLILQRNGHESHCSQKDRIVFIFAKI